MAISARKIMQVEIINPLGNVSYRRPHDHPDVLEAFKPPAIPFAEKLHPIRKLNYHRGPTNTTPPANNAGITTHHFTRTGKWGAARSPLGFNAAKATRSVSKSGVGGMSESRFTANELARVLELANILKPK